MNSISTHSSTRKDITTFLRILKGSRDKMPLHINEGYLDKVAITNISTFEEIKKNFLRSDTYIL